jgi:hypothetical protein
MFSTLRNTVAAAAILLTAQAHAVDGTVDFTGFVHNPVNTSPTTFADFIWGSAWFSNFAVPGSPPGTDPYAIFGSGSTVVRRVTLWSRSAEPVQMWVSLTNGSVSVYNGKAIGTSERIDLDNSHILWDSPYTGPVTSVSFAFKTSGGGGPGDATDQVRLAADDFRFRNATAIAAPVPSVPEPTTWALMLAGVAALVFKSRRKNKDNT